MFLARTAVDDFYYFVKRYQSPHPQPPQTLAQYIQAWMQTRSAVRECIGDFRVYLQTVLLIIVEWERDPHLLDYQDEDGVVIQRRVERIARPFAAEDFDWLDPEQFAYFAYEIANPPDAVLDQPPEARYQAPPVE